MHRRWVCANRTFDIGARTLVMGIVNVTPDSFSDGGLFFAPSHAIDQAYRLFEDGADIIDIGGESSRPGASPASVEEERKRVIPVIQELSGRARLPVSIDTVKYEIAQEALDAGAAIINDISGLQKEPRLADLAAEYRTGLVIMHMRGTPQTMQSLTSYDDLVLDIRSFFSQQIAMATRVGVQDEQIVLDPGIGFSKTAEQNLMILHRLSDFGVGPLPVMVGPSRKSMLGAITGKGVKERVYATASAVAVSIANGAHIVRVHDVKEMVDVVRVADSIRHERILDIPVNT
jgi:dihydropteroate synthase